MENNCIQMAASVGQIVAYTIGPIFKHAIGYTIGLIFKHIIDCVQLYSINGFTNIRF